MRVTILGSLLLAGCMPARASAVQQDSVPYPRADRITARVHASANAIDGDLIRVEHSLHNDATSEQKVQLFIINTPVTTIAIGGPSTSEFWFPRAGVIQDSTVLTWVTTSAVGDVAAGDSAVGFFHSAIGVIGIVRYFVQGYVSAPSTGDTAAVMVGVRQPVWLDSYQGRTIAVVPFPTDMTDNGLIVRIENLTDEACALGWIAEPRICNSLEAKQRAARRAIERGDLGAACNALGVLLNELDALPASKLREEGRSLVRLNTMHFRRTRCSH